MNLLPLAFYLTAVGLAMATLYFCFLLHRRFERVFLLNGLYYLIAFFAAGLIDLVGRYLVSKLMSGQPAETVLLLRHIFVFLMFPFIPLALFLFASFITGLLDEKIPQAWLRIYAGFWALFFLTLVVTTKNFLGGQEARFSIVLFSLLGRTAIGFYFVISGFLWLKTKKLEDVRQRRSARILALFYLCGFASYFVVAEVSSALSSGGYPVTIFLYFSLNLPPLLILRSYLTKFRPRIAATELVPEAALEGFFVKHGLSKREQEIVRLMLEGKSNREITRELYISLHTVKNHTYHIYQKLGVKNRLRLSHLIREHRHDEDG